MRGFVLIVALGLGAVAVSPPVSANLFTHILREAGEAGGKAASHGASHLNLSHLGAVGKAAAHLKSLGVARRGALAAHATPEGHWQFVNREGQVYTAGTADEMGRVMATLAPDAGHSKMTLYVSEDSVFQNRSALSQLPADAELHVVTDSGAFAIARAADDAALRVSLRPHLTMTLGDRALFDEAVYYLKRPLNRANVRTVAFEDGGKKYMPSAAQVDPESRLPLADVIDPEHVAGAFASVRGQTVIVTGSVQNGKLVITPTKGAQVTRDIDELAAAARANDVNLIVLDTDATRQPGSLNWLWQRVEVGGLADASKAATHGDFLDALGARRGGFALTAVDDGVSRVHFTVRPQDSAGLAEEASSYIGDAVRHVGGEIVTKAAEIYVRDESTEKELDARIVPGIPSDIQFAYLVSLVAGIFAWSTVRDWWHRLWPARGIDASAGWLTRSLVRVPRALIYLLGFLPAVGLPALFVQTVLQFWLTVTAPFRWIYRKFLRRTV